MKKLGLALIVVIASLACGGGDSPRAEAECTVPADANQCEECIYEECQVQCRDCFNDEDCTRCADMDTLDTACQQDEKLSSLIGCVLVAPCADECTATPSRNKRHKGGGKGKSGGRKGGKNKGGGDGEGKGGKGKKGG
jgi:hypothetical protein